jgi:hypothetical protein
MCREMDLHDDIHGAAIWWTATTAHAKQRKRVSLILDKEGNERDPVQTSCSREGCSRKECGGGVNQEMEMSLETGRSLSVLRRAWRAKHDVK